MRVAFLNPSGAVGGGERSLLNLIDSLRAADPRVEPVLVACGDGPFVRAATAAGVPTRVVPLPPVLAGLGDSGARGRGLVGRAHLIRRAAAAAPLVARYRAALREALEGVAPDLVHSNGLKTHLLAAFAAPPHVPILWHVRDYPSLRPAAAALLRLARRRARGAIAISRSVAADIRKVLPGLPVVTVLNAIDVDQFSPGPSDQTAGPVRVGLVGTFARWKGQDVFLRAAALLAGRRPELPISFEVVGGPIYDTAGSQFALAELQNLASELGVAGRVTFTGFLPDPSEAYRRLDVVVHASTLPEPFGLTIAEAMASGRATIVSRAGGAAELFDDGIDAIGVAPGDVAGLAAAMERLADDDGLRRRLGENARATAVRRFDRARLGREILGAYATFRAV